MNKEFVPYEESLVLKELGFDEPCVASYRKYVDEATLDIGFSKNELISKFKNLNEFCSAPTYSQAFRWFREKYKLRSTIIPYWIGDTYMTVIEGKMIEEIEPKQFETYEEAELACLKKLIEIVKNNE
jgi:hypothetical protein